MDEALRIKKEIKMSTQESHGNNFFLLDLKKRPIKVLKIFWTRDNKYFNGLKSTVDF